MTFLIYTVSFKAIQSILFFKNDHFWFSQVATTPYPSSLTATLSPEGGGTPVFFHEIDRKGCTLDYLDGLGHFLFGFCLIGNHLLGVVTTSLVRRELNIQWEEWSLHRVSVHTERKTHNTHLANNIVNHVAFWICLIKCHVIRYPCYSTHHFEDCINRSLT